MSEREKLKGRRVRDRDGKVLAIGGKVYLAAGPRGGIDPEAPEVGFVTEFSADDGPLGDRVHVRWTDRAETHDLYPINDYTRAPDLIRSTQPEQKKP